MYMWCNLTADVYKSAICVTHRQAQTNTRKITTVRTIRNIRSQSQSIMKINYTYKAYILLENRVRQSQGMCNNSTHDKKGQLHDN